MAHRGPTKSGFRESTGLGYALEKIGDPGRGRKDETSLLLAVGSLDELDAEVSRIETWAATKGANIDAHLVMYENASKACRTALENFRTQKPAREAAKRVSELYQDIWGLIERF